MTEVELAAITSGIPQGLIFGLIMFNVFINNLENETDASSENLLMTQNLKRCLKSWCAKLRFRKRGFSAEPKGN